MITLLANLVINPNDPGKYYIGDGNDLIVRIPADMRMFKKYTMGKTLIMGHNTFNQTGPLGGRQILVLSSKDILWTATNDVVFMKNMDWDSIANMDEEFIVCGGTMIYKLALPYANKLRLTITELYPCSITEYIGDKLFPDFNKYGPWNLEIVSPYAKQNGCSTTRGQLVDNFFVAEYTK